MFTYYIYYIYGISFYNLVVEAVSFVKAPPSGQTWCVMYSVHLDTGVWSQTTYYMNEKAFILSVCGCGLYAM